MTREREELLDHRIFFPGDTTCMPVVNPVLVHDQLSGAIFPKPFQGEVFLLNRKGVSLEVKSTLHGKLTGSGEFFLSNTRIVFHCSKKKSQPQFLAYQIDISEIQNPKFEQPIFGANYLCGETASPSSGTLSDRWKITFYEGGCGTFLPVLNELLTRALTGRSTGLNGVRVQFAPAEAVAYADPNDPSVVYLQQPVPGIVASAPPAE
jgi:hypothetical protein